MEYVNLGKTGLKVSKICLGCMGFGELDRGGIPGKTAEKEAREIIKYALEHGINFFDTANYYSLGASEEILGQALKDYAKRKKENKEKEFYVHDSTVDFLDIDEVKLD